MLRYFKRNILLVFIALIIGIFTQILAPFLAIMEQQMIDQIISGNMNGFYRFLLWTSLMVLASAGFFFLNSLTQKRFQVKFEENLRNDLFNSFIGRRHLYFEDKDTSEMMSYIKNHASTISNNFTTPIFTLISYGVMAIVIIGIMVYYNLVLALVSFICVLPSIIFPLYFNKQLNLQMTEKLNQDAAITFEIKESLNAHEVISAFGIFSRFFSRFTKASHDLANASYKVEVTVSLLENVARILQKCTWFISFMIAGNMAIHNETSVGTIVMFISLCSELNTCVTLYAQVIPLLLSIKSDIKKVISIIDYREKKIFGEKEPTFKRSITIEKLRFRYNENVHLLENLNFSIYKGEKVAIVGESGSGKSTLIKLITAHYGNYTGSINYDNVELHEIDEKKLHDVVMVIHQNTFIFNDSVRFNICLGETFSESAMEKALLLSGVDHFLSQIPGGLDGGCGENGSRLSGGQKQRIALARALIRGIDFLILDEGISAVDVETANKIESELLNIGNLTLLTITHRIQDGLLQHYDKVFQLNNGKLEERK